MLAAERVSEQEIRTALQRQYDAGKLRRESYELVQSLLDRIVLGGAAKSAVASAPDSDSGFTSTTIIEPVQLDPEHAADLQVQPGTVLRERYLLQKEISGGSMGTVFKALDRRLAEADTGDHWVAIKVLAPKLAQHGDALRALQQEGAQLAYVQLAL